MRTRNTNNRSAKTMRKSLLAIVLMTLLTAGPVTAQIFLDDESLTYRDGWLGAMDEMGNIIPFHEVDWDQANYLPTGSGILMLGLLGGAYLVEKKRKEEE